MKISLNWLRDYVALDASADEICRAITFLGFEVENVIRTGAPQLNHVLVGEVLTRNKHPNADKLSVCTVSLSEALGVKTIVCGAQNYTVGDRVPVALPGAVLPGDFVIKQSKIRGESSDGMMCSAKELGISEDAAGLMILADRPALGTPINAILPPGDTVFDIEITPNRPDCLSHVGIARELAAWFKKDLVCPQGKFRGALPAGAATRQDLLAVVRVEAPEDCPLYLAHVVTGIKIGPSPAWLQQRLAAVGLRSINNVVDIGNFVMLESGQPLHAFDARKLAGAQIVVRRAVDGEKITTLDGKERTLTGSMLVIADGAKPVVIAGIMGGENSGVTAETTDLVIECAIFKRQSIRATSKRLASMALIIGMAISRARLKWIPRSSSISSPRLRRLKLKPGFGRRMLPKRLLGARSTSFLSSPVVNWSGRCTTLVTLLRGNVRSRWLQLLCANVSVLISPTPI